MRRVLITGGAGLLGSTLIRLAPADVDLHATRRRREVQNCTAHSLDLANAEAVRALLCELRPTLVIHTAYAKRTAERDIWEATRSVVAGCAASGADLVHMSTDMVLDGENAPYDETALPAPVDEYGRWKARAEDYVRETAPEAAIVRTSLITSFDPPDPATAWVAEGLRDGSELRLFADELRCPIAAEDLALQLWELAALDAAGRAGVWHMAGPETLSRYALGLLIAARLRLSAETLVPAPNSTAPSPRPRDLRLLTPRADAALRTRPRPISMLK